MVRPLTLLVPGLLALLALSLAAPAADDPPAAPRVLRFYGLDGDPDLEKLNKALAEHDAALARGPLTLGSRPGKAFVAVEAPATVEPRDLERALKRGKVGVEDLVWFGFEGRTGDLGGAPNFGPGYTSRDFVVNMSGELWWFDELGARSQVYAEPRADAEELVERYAKLVGPFGGGALGELARETLALELAAPADERAWRKASKKLEKLPGATRVALEDEGRRVVVELRQEGLATALPAADGDLAAGAPAGARLRCDPSPLLATLAEADLEAHTAE